MSKPFKYINKLQGCRVLVVGGSSGVGFGVAEAAVECGAIVTVASSNQSKLDNAVGRLKEHAKATGVSADDVSGTIIDLAEAAGLDDRIVNMLEFASKSGKIDHVVFTAGDPVKALPLKDQTVERIHESFMVRNVAPILVAKHLQEYMTFSNQSSFTLTGGTNTTRPFPNWSVVAGAGACVEGLTRGFAVDLKPIRVNCVQVGAVKTELFEKALSSSPPEFIDSIAKDTVSGTIGKPDEVVEAFLYPMKAYYTNGTTIVADGGRLVGKSQEVSEFN
jgi:NAD(P)-dependent dehydrogenase (short-subunit alcohol dehydrogenase family)